MIVAIGGKERPLMQIVKLFNIDLVKIRGNGDFKCPRCRVKISPDDQTEETYTILGTIMKGENLERIILQCNKCGSQIQITGFQILTKIT
jgi:predicted nucleic-acid-binding Zn-ribbon protein